MFWRIGVILSGIIFVRLLALEKQVPDEKSSGEEADQTGQANETEPITSGHVLVRCMSYSEMHA